jgi:hypothetical protein
MNRPGPVLLAAGALSTGCAAPLTRYPAMSPRESLEILARRAESVRTLSAACDVTLTDAAGESIRLDGAIAAEFPDRLRMRAWKFGNAVFDITVVQGRTWMLTGDTSGGPESGVMSGADRLPRAIGLLGPEYFRAADAAPVETPEEVLIVTGPLFDDAAATCEIDRQTLTVRQLVFTESESAGDRRVRFEGYRMVEGLPWPTGLEFSGPEGVIGVRLRDVAINEPVAESAFVPPRRAVEQP